jgi:hypothetical protein
MLTRSDKDLSENHSKLSRRMDCRIKSGNDEWVCESSLLFRETVDSRESGEDHDKPHCKTA